MHIDQAAKGLEVMGWNGKDQHVRGEILAIDGNQVRVLFETSHVARWRSIEEVDLAVTFTKDDRVKTSDVDNRGNHFAGTVLAVVRNGLIDVRLDHDQHVRRYSAGALTMLYSPSAEKDTTPHPMQDILDLIDVERAKHIKAIEDAQISLGDLKKAKKLIAEVGR